MPPKSKYKKIKAYKQKQLLIMFVIIMCLISFVIVFGRYVTNNINDFFVRSKEFYFYSDKLDENNAIYQIDNWSGVDEYTITINMNSRKNNLKVATYDIGYNISYECSDNAICQLNKTEGIIYANTNSDFFNLTITPNRQLTTGDKVVVNVEVESTSEYKKTLKGQFTLVVGKERLSYQITDQVNSTYMELRITNTLSYYVVEQAFDEYQIGDKIDIDKYLTLSDDKKAKCYSSIVTMKFDPRNVLLDITNEAYKDAIDIKSTTINGKKYVNEITIPVEAISSRDIKFYKVDVTKNYTYPLGTSSSIVTITSK